MGFSESNPGPLIVSCGRSVLLGACRAQPLPYSGEYPFAAVQSGRPSGPPAANPPLQHAINPIPYRAVPGAGRRLSLSAEGM